MRRIQKVFRLRLAALEKNELIAKTGNATYIKLLKITKTKKRNDGYKIRRLYFVSKFIFKFKQIIRAYLKKL